MALGLNTESSSGDFMPIITYSAVSGRFTRIDRSQDDAGDWDKDEVDITDGFMAAVDMANIEVGWMAFVGGTPDFKMVVNGETFPERPSSNHKQAFRVTLMLGTDLGGTVRQFSHTAKCVLRVFDELDDVFRASPEKQEGKIPVIKMTGTEAIKTKTPQGTNTHYAPKLEIVKWIDRPDEMNVSEAVDSDDETASLF